MALAQQTATILLDEPTTWLDLRYQVDILELLQTLTREHGRTVVTVLHDLTQASRYCDHLVVLESGKVRAQGLPEQVLTPALLRSVFQLEAEIHPDPISRRPMCVMK